MSERSLRVARDIILMVSVHEEMENVRQANTAAMNEKQLQNHIHEINTGLVAHTHLSTKTG
jgi:hypothetical protein